MSVSMYAETHCYGMNFKKRRFLTQEPPFLAPKTAVFSAKKRRFYNVLITKWLCVKNDSFGSLRRCLCLILQFCKIKIYLFSIGISNFFFGRNSLSVLRKNMYVWKFASLKFAHIVYL